MRLQLSLWLGLIFLISEVMLAATKRARLGSASNDGNSLRMLWIVIGVSIFLGIQTVFWWPIARLPAPAAFSLAGLFLFLLGLTLRWYAIIQLGRFFTVDVAIASDHQLVESGPYRFVRHPSYTGALLAFIGFGLSLHNWVALVVIITPITCAFLYRIRLEERALVAALGERYLAYRRRTKALLPPFF